MLEARLINSFAARHPAEVADFLEALPADECAEVLRLLSHDATHRLLGWISAATIARALQHLSPAAAGAVLEPARHDVAQRVLRAMEPERREEVLGRVAKERGATLRRGLSYPARSAGALMDPRPPTIAEDLTVGATLASLAQRPEAVLRHVFVVDGEGVLRGAVELGALLAAEPGASVRPLLATQRFEGVSAHSSIDSVQHVAWHGTDALPVLDQGRLVGVLRFEALHALEPRGPDTDHAAHALAELFGIGVRASMEGAAGLLTGDDEP